MSHHKIYIFEKSSAKGNTFTIVKETRKGYSTGYCIGIKKYIEKDRKYNYTLPVTLCIQYTSAMVCKSIFSVWGQEA